MEYVLSSFQKFLNENKAASAAMGNNGALNGIEALKAMKDTLSSLPEFQSLKAKFSIHIQICYDAKSSYEKRNLELVAGSQQVTRSTDSIRILQQARHLKARF